jgi:DUF4097 and DUF4098 domain-containing protein YvlB
MSQETIRILKMLEEGKISSQEANRLLLALKQGSGEDAFRHHGHRHGLAARIIRDVDPGRIAAEAMASVKESLKGLEDIEDFDLRLKGRASADGVQTLDIPAEGINAVALNQPRSDITVKGTEGGKITVRTDLEVWAGDDQEAEERLRSLKLTSDIEDGVLKIKLDGPPWTKKRWTRADFEISLPKELKLELATASGDIEVAGMSGGTVLSTASGDLDVRNCRESVELSSASGDIAIAECRGTDVRIKTASGDVSVQAEGDLACSTASGDIEAEMANIRTLDIRTVSGDQSLKLGLAPDGRISVTSVSGDIGLELEGQPSAMLEVSTLSGDIDCGAELQESKKSGRSLTGKLGQGQGQISVRTTSGDINIE